MKQKFLFSYFLSFICFIGFSQSFDINPYLKALTNIKDGYFEGGIEFHNSSKNFSILPYVRLPLTNKQENLIVIDRFTNTWRGVVAFQWENDLTTLTSNTKVHRFGGQIEWGRAKYKYYPTGTKSNEVASSKSSVAGEILYSYYSALRVHVPGRQKNVQLRLRYANETKPSNEVGVVMPPNTFGVVTTSNMVISPPSKTPSFSPAFAFQKYRGTGNVSYTHALYYDMQGIKDQNGPFNNLHRMRYEFWVFYYPIIPNSPNVKLGIGPFISLRTKGTDQLNRLEYGGQATVKIGRLFQSFF